MISMSEIIYLASFKWPKKCKACGLEIPVNAEGYWNKSEKLYYHKACKPSANPTSAGASGRTQAGKPSGVVLTSPEADVSGRLALAVGILCRQFGIEPEQVNPDSVVLAEIMRQLYGSLWLNKEMR